jgi:predicted transcriptional regulator
VSATMTCQNPRCSCASCSCAHCTCGGARIGELERRVIDILWEEPGTDLSGRQVANALPDYAYTTVATVLDRLAGKGLVQRRMDGRTIRFAATGTRATHTAALMHEALGATSDPDAALVRFAETVSASEARALREALEALEGKPKSKSR